MPTVLFEVSLGFIEMSLGSTKSVTVFGKLVRKTIDLFHQRFALFVSALRHHNGRRQEKECEKSQ